MKDRPILFSGPMIRALLEGRKTQTRRIVKPQPNCKPHLLVVRDRLSAMWGVPETHSNEVVPCPYGQPGDLLWVRETWAMESNLCYQDVYDKPGNPLGPVRWHGNEEEGRWFDCPRYRASEPETLLVTPDDESGEKMRWKPSIHMPRWAARLTLELTDVRIERVQDISEEDAQAEGVILRPTPVHRFADHRIAFTVLWESINGPTAWNLNPWVWALTFRVHQVNVDEFLRSKAA